MVVESANASRGGLEGVVVADTGLSDVDGMNGRLVIAGAAVEALAGSVAYEALCARLFSIGDGRSRDPDELRAALGAARVRAFARLPGLGGALALSNGMDALRAALAQLDDGADEIALVAATAVFAAAWARTRVGATPLSPDPHAAHAADYLRMTGANASAGRAAALEAYLVTVSDHGMNASTFTARVVASTGSDLVSSVVAAVGALKGPLHGGAPGPVLDLLDAIGEVAAVRPYLVAELAAGRRIMGMGHRIYRVRDPRALVLERALSRLGDRGADVSSGPSKGPVPPATGLRRPSRLRPTRVSSGPSKGPVPPATGLRRPSRLRPTRNPRLALARAVEAGAEALLAERHPERPLRANVEFYTAVLLEAVGLDRSQFSLTFAVGRVAGWLAHAFEQRRTGRLIRPAARYVGETPAMPA